MIINIVGEASFHLEMFLVQHFSSLCLNPVQSKPCLITLNIVESASFQSCLPPCFQGTLKIFLSRSIQARPGICPDCTLDSSHGLILCRVWPLSMVTSKNLKHSRKMNYILTCTVHAGWNFNPWYWDHILLYMYLYFFFTCHDLMLKNCGITQSETKVYASWIFS